MTNLNEDEGWIQSFLNGPNPASFFFYFVFTKHLKVNK